MFLYHGYLYQDELKTTDTCQGIKGSYNLFADPELTSFLHLIQFGDKWHGNSEFITMRRQK